MKRRRKGFACINDDGELVYVHEKEWRVLQELGVWKAVPCYVTYDDGKKPKRKKTR